MQVKILFFLVIVMFCENGSSEVQKIFKKLSANLQKCDIHRLIDGLKNVISRTNISCLSEKRSSQSGDWTLTVRCKYTYSCPLDPAKTHRKGFMDCDQQGQWKGIWPDCPSDKLMKYIMSITEQKPQANFFNKVIFQKICSAQKICERFRSIGNCRYLRYTKTPRSRWNIQNFQNLCISCHVTFCRPIRLL